MKFFHVILCGIGLAAVLADESTAPPPVITAARVATAPRAWLGLQVSKPDESIVAHLPSLPTGIGFVIRLVDKDGPADAAGLRVFDVLWKMDDQMLVNEGQLAALLRLSKPGDKVTLHGFRAGKPLEFVLKLGEAPPNSRMLPGEIVDQAILPGDPPQSPMRLVNIAEKRASYSTEDGRVEVLRAGDVHEIKITGPKGDTIYEGEIPVGGSLKEIPEGWRRRVHALTRGLEHALEGRVMTARQPRPRVVSPPGKNQ